MSGSFPRQLGAQVFIAAMALAAMACFYIALSNWQSTDPIKFLCYLGVALQPLHRWRKAPFVPSRPSPSPLASFRQAVGFCWSPRSRRVGSRRLGAPIGFAKQRNLRRPRLAVSLAIGIGLLANASWGDHRSG